MCYRNSEPLNAVFECLSDPVSNCEMHRLSSLEIGKQLSSFIQAAISATFTLRHDITLDGNTALAFSDVPLRKHKVLARVVAWTA